MLLIVLFSFQYTALHDLCVQCALYEALLVVTGILIHFQAPWIWVLIMCQNILGGMTVE